MGTMVAVDRTLVTVIFRLEKKNHILLEKILLNSWDDGSYISINEWPLCTGADIGCQQI